MRFMLNNPLALSCSISQAPHGLQPGGSGFGIPMLPKVSVRRIHGRKGPRTPGGVGKRVRSLFLPDYANGVHPTASTKVEIIRPLLTSATPPYLYCALDWFEKPQFIS